MIELAIVFLGLWLLVMLAAGVGYLLWTKRPW